MLFIVYYIIDNTGMKMARDGAFARMAGHVAQFGHTSAARHIRRHTRPSMIPGCSMPTPIRICGGALLNREKRELAVKEVVIEDMDPQRAAQMLEELRESCAGFIADYPGRQDYRAYWAGGYPSRTVQEVIARLEHAVSYMANSRSGTLVAALNSVPLLHNYRILHPAPDSALSKAMCWFCARRRSGMDCGAGVAETFPPQTHDRTETYSGNKQDTRKFMIKLDSVEEAIEDFRQGKFVIVVDDEDRENEGDLIVAAEKITPEQVNFMLKNARGVLCAPITMSRARELELDPQVQVNTSVLGTPSRSLWTNSRDVRPG